MGRRVSQGDLLDFTRHFDVEKTGTLACPAVLSKIIDHQYTVMYTSLFYGKVKFFKSHETLFVSSKLTYTRNGQKVSLHLFTFVSIEPCTIPKAAQIWLIWCGGSVVCFR